MKQPLILPLPYAFCTTDPPPPCIQQESLMKTWNVDLTFESVDEIPRCDYLNEISSAVLLHGTMF